MTCNQIEKKKRKKEKKEKGKRNGVQADKFIQSLFYTKSEQNTNK